MKPTEDNIKMLEKLGFSCDYKKTKDPRDKEWYSLSCGWGFRLDAHRDFKSLFRAALKWNKEDQ